MTAISEKKVRHILGLSGGKDSTALAIYLKERVPEMEYVFCDTEKELPETYEYLSRLATFLGNKITWLKHDWRGFDHWMVVYGGYLPSPQNRWCTKHLKLKPYEKYIGADEVISYVGIRADENREGLISTKPNIKTVFPFKEDGINKEDVFRILDESGVGIPEYYSWRSRSGCYFCFFQQKIEWVGLLENHPDLFELSQAYEKVDTKSGKNFTWCQKESLAELVSDKRMQQIKDDNAKRIEQMRTKMPKARLAEIFEKVVEEDSYEEACLICQL